jgi:hypothetical protein
VNFVEAPVLASSTTSTSTSRIVSALSSIHGYRVFPTNSGDYTEFRSIFIVVKLAHFLFVFVEIWMLCCSCTDEVESILAWYINVSLLRNRHPQVRHRSFVGISMFAKKCEG